MTQDLPSAEMHRMKDDIRQDTHKFTCGTRLGMRGIVKKPVNRCSRGLEETSSNSFSQDLAIERN